MTDIIPGLILSRLNSQIKTTLNLTEIDSTPESKNFSTIHILKTQNIEWRPACRHELR